MWRRFANHRSHFTSTAKEYPRYHHERIRKGCRFSFRFHTKVSFYNQSIAKLQNQCKFLYLFSFLKKLLLIFWVQKKIIQRIWISKCFICVCVCVCFSGEEIRKKASILFGIQFDKKRYEDLVNLLDTIKKFKDLVRDFQCFLYFLLKRIF